MDSRTAARPTPARIRRQPFGCEAAAQIGAGPQARGPGLHG
ncbi:hypothetical protein [Piscinibacter koreensis]|nr:hypothetical protein [Schlegelella koreensis]